MAAVRVGIFGGSFNPPHRGHLALARTVLDRDLADRVVMVPAATPPHKAAPAQADAPTRLAMTRLIAREDARLEVNGLELERSGPSFTVDTVRQLMKDNPGAQYRLVIGSDMARSFATWREYPELLRRAPPLVAERPDCVLAGTVRDMYPGMTEEEAAVMQSGRFEMTPVDISSTKVRKLLAEGAGDAELLDCLTGPVLRFIRENNLYV